MPWGSITMCDLRISFINDVKNNIGSFSFICRKYNITRKTGYKWWYRFKNGEPLVNKSRRPFNSPNRIPEHTEKLIIAQRNKYPFWGAKKLKKIIENELNLTMPSTTTFSNVLKRNNMISKTQSESSKKYIRYEKEYPNEMWQIDFKGQFKMKTGQYCYPLTIKDDNSRYGIAVEAKLNQKAEGVKESLKRCFKENGKPDSILFDNGKPWGDSKKYAYTKIEVWLMELDILPKHGRILHPQTQGKIESFNKALKEELLKRKEIENIEEAQKEFDKWLYQYNNIRPHEGINLEVPIKKYKKSKKLYKEEVEKYKYRKGSKVVKVDKRGYIRINKKLHFLSEALIDKNVALIKNANNQSEQNIQFHNFSIAVFNKKNNKIIKKGIRRM